MKHIFKYEWRLFLRNKGAVVAWLVMLIIGLYALYYGRSFYLTQTSTIMTIDTAYQNRVNAQINHFSADTVAKEGKAKYKNARDPFMNEFNTRPMAWKTPTALQALTIGQSDTEPFYYNLWVYNNVYNTKQVELRNPDKLLSGNFDLAFVFTYLLPLLIIAFSYQVASQDEESGITGLLLTQGASLKSIILNRLIFRCCLVLILVLLLSTVGCLINQVGIFTAMGWVGISFLYTVGWFAVVYAFVSFRNTGSVTAIKLISTWILLLLFIPSLINGFQHNDKQGKLDIADAARDYPGHIWEMKRSDLADTIFQIKPEWKTLFDQSKRDTNVLRSSAYAFLMGQQLNRIGESIDSQSLVAQQRIERLNFINPAYAAQTLYNKLAGTETNNYIGFRKAVTGYQLERFEKMTAKRLPAEELTLDEYTGYPVFNQPSPILNAVEWLKAISPLFIFLLVFVWIGNYNWKKSKTI